MENLLISACLLGCNTTYRGDSNYQSKITELKRKYNLIPVCPEQLGGLTTPRDPSERKADKVISCKNIDVTSQFKKGAKEALSLAKLFDCKIAVLKENSPSCGYGKIYDGTFTGVLVPGNGVTADLLCENGIKVFGESKIDEL